MIGEVWVKKIFVLVLILVTFFLGYHFSQRKNQFKQSLVHKSVEKGGKSTEKTKMTSKKKIENKNTPQKNNKIEKDAFVPKNKEEMSLFVVHEFILANYDKSDAELEMINFFKEKDLVPILSVSENPYTGKKTILRTKKNLPGTRYSHAQFFSNESGGSFLQHYSIEFRPSKDAFDRVVALVESNKSLTEKTVSADKTFVSYKLSSGHIIWVKKMMKADLKNDPFNAYSPEDEGTIRLAVEKDIHPQGEKHSH